MPDDLVHGVVAHQDYDDVAISGVRITDEVFLIGHDVVLQIVHLYVDDVRPK